MYRQRFDITCKRQLTCLSHGICLMAAAKGYNDTTHPSVLTHHTLPREREPSSGIAFRRAERRRMATACHIQLLFAQLRPLPRLRPSLSPNLSLPNVCNTACNLSVSRCNPPRRLPIDTRPLVLDGPAAAPCPCGLVWKRWPTHRLRLRLRRLFLAHLGSSCPTAQRCWLDSNAG
ncbi:hypothetical protein LZ31DRAFT_38310 [Colletotrichum somersetense]|nr:hypothetical protein LZ31DRAFT_38310 [Colletotrichum somersetense]